MKLHSLKNLSIRIKLLLLLSMICLVLLAGFGLFTYRIATSEILENNKQMERNFLEQTLKHLDYLAKDSLKATNFFVLSEDLHSYIESGEQMSNDYSFQYSNQFMASISQLINSRHYLRSMIIYSDSLPPITYSNSSLQPIMSYEAIKKLDYYRLAEEQPGHMFWGTYSRNKAIYNDTRNGDLLLMGKLMNGFTGRSDGFLILGLDSEDLLPATPENGMRFYIINREGEILSDSTGDWAGRDVSELPYFDGSPISEVGNNSWQAGEDWLSVHAQSNISGWHLLVVQPKANLINKLEHIKTVTSLSVIIAFLLSILVSWYFSSVITKPIIRILTSMRMFQLGDFEQSVRVEGKDELSQLSRGYNNMVRNIRELIVEQLQSELKLKDSELKLLQSQMNPHFLYNTLNIIYYAAHNEGASRIADMVYSLSRMFRISLSDGMEFITLEHEVEFIRNYLFLQQARFPDQFDYEIELEPLAMGVEIPKLIVQPFVENAVLHGIQPSESRGFISIRGSIRRQCLCIEIIDNGVGMSAEQLSLLDEEAPASSSSRRGYAVQNVQQRLRLYYGDKASLDIRSVQHHGTSVTITIKKPTESVRMLEQTEVKAHV